MEVGLGWTEESSAGEIMNRSRKDPGFLDWVPLETLMEMAMVLGDGFKLIVEKKYTTALNCT